MNPFEMVVAIIFLVTVGKVLQGFFRTREGQPAPAEAETLRVQDEVRNLRERIQVLERVITDTHKSADLDREIERLRDR